MTTVVSTAYGASHLRYLGALIESVHRTQAADRLLLVLDTHTPGEFLTRAARYPFVEVLTTTLPGASAPRVERVYSKVQAWVRGLQACAEGSDVVFLDADTLVTRPQPFQPVFAVPFDVAYTRRPHAWPVNSGVVFARPAPGVQALFSAWRALTQHVAGSPMLAAESVARWGAIDQATLLMACTLYSGKEPLRIVDVDGDRWNCERCAPLATAAVFHLKGCLPYLLGERTFTVQDERGESPCGELFAYWRQCDAAFVEAHCPTSSLQPTPNG